MARIRRLPISPWFVAAVLVALAEWLIAPAAQAGCGDYVMIGGHAAKHTQPASANDRGDGRRARMTQRMVRFITVGVQGRSARAVSRARWRRLRRP
jgi:hypothetical protein